MEAILKCPSCQSLFNLDNHAPFIAKCGHSFCKFCIYLNKGENQGSCPLCLLPFAMKIDICVSNHKLEEIIKAYTNSKQEKKSTIDNSPVKISTQNQMIYVKPERRGKSPAIIIRKTPVLTEENQETPETPPARASLRIHKISNPLRYLNKANNSDGNENEQNNNNKMIIENIIEPVNENIELMALEENDQSIVTMTLSLKDEYSEFIRMNPHHYAQNIQEDSNSNNIIAKVKKVILNELSTKEEVYEQLYKELVYLIPSPQKRKPKEGYLKNGIDNIIFKDKFPFLSIKLFPPNDDFFVGLLDPETYQPSHGVIYCSNGDYYEGDINNDKREGLGTLDYKGGSRYEGLFKGNLPDGYGKLIQLDGEIYVGGWKEGKINGSGIRYHNNGDRYIGNYVNNIRNGNGHYIFTNGDSYDGNWKNGKANGLGKFFFKNGNVYEGEFMDNLLNGRGILKIFNDSIYTGKFRNGVIYGQGLMQMVNGHTYKGEFYNGKRHGYGILYNSRNEIISKGRWANDKFFNENTV